MSFLTSARPTLSRAFAPLTNSPASSARFLSKLNVIGRLAAAPELITTSSGRELVRYAIGTSTGRGENQITSWWKVAAFMEDSPSRANLLALGKGSMVYVEAEASMRKFEREGRTEAGLSLIQQKYDVLDRREGGAEGQGEVIEEQ